MPKRVLSINPTNIQSAAHILPPMGAITNASYIPRKYEIKLIDENIKIPNYERIDADLVTISATTFTARRAYDIATYFKKKRIPVILGGIHPSSMPNEARKYATSVVIGNGEPVWKELLGDFEKGKLKKTYKPELFDLRKSKVPRRDLLKNKYLFDSIETARGCPFNCEFCSVTQFQGFKYRYKPLELVRKELESIKKKNLFLVDDNFLGVGKEAEKRTIKLLKLLKEYNINWFGQTSINIADNPKILKLAKESGAIAFFIGFESLNEDFLKSARKTANLKKGVKSYKKVVDRIHDHGIAIIGSFMIGTDYDTKESIEDLKSFIKETNIDVPAVHPLTPFPGSRLYERFRKEKRFFNNSYWLEKPLPIFTFKPKQLSIEDMYETCFKLLKDLNNLKTSIKRFYKTLKATKNLKGSILALLENMIHGKTYKKYMKRVHKSTKNI